MLFADRQERAPPEPQDWNRAPSDATAFIEAAISDAVNGDELDDWSALWMFALSVSFIEGPLPV